MPRRGSHAPSAIYDDIAGYLDGLFNEWQWGFTHYEVLSILKERYPNKITGRRAWGPINRYLQDRSRADLPKKLRTAKLFVSKPWQQVFWALITYRGTQNVVPTWAVPARCSEALRFYGRKPEYIWARIFFECKVAVRSIKQITQNSGINVLPHLIAAKEKKLWLSLTEIGTLLYSPRITTQYTTLEGSLDRLVGCDLVEVRDRTEWHKEYSVPELVVDAIKHISDLKGKPGFLTECPVWIPLFRQLRTSRAKAHRKLTSA